MSDRSGIDYLASGTWTPERFRRAIEHDLERCDPDSTASLQRVLMSLHHELCVLALNAEVPVVARYATQLGELLESHPEIHRLRDFPAAQRNGLRLESLWEQANELQSIPSQTAFRRMVSGGSTIAAHCLAVMKRLVPPKGRSEWFVSTTDLKCAAGFSSRGQFNTVLARLRTARLIETDTASNPRRHRLTEWGLEQITEWDSEQIAASGDDVPFTTRVAREIDMRDQALSDGLKPSLFEAY